MSSHYESPIRRPLIIGDKSYHDISVEVAAPVEGKANKLWWTVFSIALAAFLWGIGSIIYTIGTGIGVWGVIQRRDTSDRQRRTKLPSQVRGHRQGDGRVAMPSCEPIRGSAHALARSRSNFD